MLHAMSASRPILATSIDSNLEVLGGPIPAALIVPPGDHCALAAAIERLADDPALREPLGICARQRWEAVYTIDRAQRSYQETCQDLIRCRFGQEYRNL
jgi:glycosyltransferase involved in cell wall biosynthesis